MLTLQTKAMAMEVAGAFKAVIDTHTGLKLYKSTFTPDVNSTLADFLANEVAFTGYGTGDLTGVPWVMGLNDSDEVELVSGGVAIFTQTATAAVDTAGGWFLVDDAGPPPTLLWGHGELDAPFAFTKAGNTLRVTPQLNFPLTADAGVKTIVGT